MDMVEIHDYARRLLDAHGDKAEWEAAQKAAKAINRVTGTRPATGVAFRPRSRRCAVRMRVDRGRVRQSHLPSKLPVT